MPVTGISNPTDSWALIGGLKPTLHDTRSSPGDSSGQAPEIPGESGDQVSLSPEARKLAAQSGQSDQRTQGDLTEDQKREVERLQAVDKAVRAHEQAHLSAAGGLALGPPHFEYQTGPDGKQYAIGGEVQIDTSPISGDPEATIKKEEQVERAANAPADPSSQDRRVAAQAAALVQEAQAQLAQTKSGNPSGKVDVFA